MARNESPWEAEAPDNAQYPRDDNGENFIFFLALAPFRLMAAPFRFIIGIASAREIDEEIAKRGVLDGAGSYNAEHLEARRATVRSSGAVFAIVRASEMLRAEISGAGYMEYIGQPTVSESISGLGLVRRR